MMLVLGFFMIAVSYTQKMRDLSYEQGVLRSIGLTQEQSRRLFYYEALCIVLTAFISGIAVGLTANFFVSTTFG